VSRSRSTSMGARLRRRLGNDRAFVGAAIGVAAGVPTSLVVTGLFDREPASAANLAAVGLTIVIGIAGAAARPVRSSPTSGRHAGGRSR
jgi:hypothetical protein